MLTVMFAHRARVLVTLGSETRRGRVVSKVNDLDAYTVAVGGRRITLSASDLAPASQLRPNNISKTTEKGE